MRIRITLATTCAAALIVGACGGSSEPPAPAPAAAPAATPPAATPEPAASTVSTDAEKKADVDEDGHHHTPPHGGALLELGEHFGFLELLVDEATGRVTLHVLDGEAEKAVRVTHPTLTMTITQPSGVAAPVTLSARASALTGETVGDSSEFVATVDALKGAKAVKARLATISVKGTTFENLALEWPDDHKN